MTSLLFWDVTQRILVFTDVSVQPICTMFNGQRSYCLTLQDRTDGLSRNVGKYWLRCITSHKDEELIYIVVEAWNHATFLIFAYTIISLYVKKFPADRQEQKRLGFKGNQEQRCTSHDTRLHHSVARHMSGEEASYPLMLLGSKASKINSSSDYSVSVHRLSRINKTQLNCSCVETSNYCCGNTSVTFKTGVKALLNLT
jgi:hypothetical protein